MSIIDCFLSMPLTARSITSAQLSRKTGGAISRQFFSPLGTRAWRNQTHPEQPDGAAARIRRELRPSLLHQSSPELEQRKVLPVLLVFFLVCVHRGGCGAFDGLLLDGEREREMDAEKRGERRERKRNREKELRKRTEQVRVATLTPKRKRNRKKRNESERIYPPENVERRAVSQV